jgi:GT2 family glycosyltransferase
MSASTQGRPHVSIVLVSWNSWDDIERCIESLYEHTTSATIELVIVDNASPDGTARRARETFPSAVLVENTENVGFARACNQGMAAASADLLLVLNSDTYVADDVVGRAADYLRHRPEIAMLGVELQWPDGRRNYTARRRLSVRWSLFERLWFYKLVPSPRREELLLGGFWNEDRDVEVDWLAGAFMLLRKEAFQRSGGFDPRFFMYGEDSEWCMRLRRMGYRILYAPRVGVVYHHGSSSSGSVWSRREILARGHRGGLQAYAMIYGRRRAALYRLAELFGCVVRWGVYRAAALIRPSVYLRDQADHYGWLARFYLSPGDLSLPSSR